MEGVAKTSLTYIIFHDILINIRRAQPNYKIQYAWTLLEQLNKNYFQLIHGIFLNYCTNNLCLLFYLRGLQHLTPLSTIIQLYCRSGVQDKSPPDKIPPKTKAAPDKKPPNNECFCPGAYVRGAFVLFPSVSFIIGGNLRTRRKPPTCRKLLTNFMTLGCFQFTSP